MLLFVGFTIAFLYVLSSVPKQLGGCMGPGGFLGSSGGVAPKLGDRSQAEIVPHSSRFDKIEPSCIRFASDSIRMMQILSEIWLDTWLDIQLDIRPDIQPDTLLVHLGTWPDVWPDTQPDIRPEI